MPRRESLSEMILHPISNLRKIQGLDRLPDRRISKNKRHPADYDPLRGEGMAQGLYKALGLYAQEESRIELYENFREMDYDAVLSAVLDAFGEDMSQVDPEYGDVISVQAGNSDLTKILRRTLVRIGAHDLAFPVGRTLGRDGDVFMHVAAARGDGVIALRAYDPWMVARIEDDIGRLTGFAPADDRGNPSKVETHSVPAWKVAHFRLPARDLTNIYGAESSFLWGARITWRELQLMLDQVVMQRLLRRPDRLAVLVDTMGLSHDDAHIFVEDLQRRMYREWHLNPNGIGGGLLGGSQFMTQGALTDGGQDLIIPRGPQNRTEITNLPATNQNDLLRDLDMMYRNLANGVGFPHGFMRGEGNYRSDQSLSRQSQPFAKRATRLQRAFLRELVRVCMIDLAYKGLDPVLPEHEFTLHMAPVSPILEMERHEVIQMKMDRLERAFRIGIDNQFPPDFWVPFVLRTYGGFNDDLVHQLYPQAPSAEAHQPSANVADIRGQDAAYMGEMVRNGNGKKGKPAPDRQALEEAFRNIVPAAADMDISINTSDVLDTFGDVNELRPSVNGKKMLVEAWKQTTAEQRKKSVNESLVDTRDGRTHRVNGYDKAKRASTQHRDRITKIRKDVLESVLGRVK